MARELSSREKGGLIMLAISALIAACYGWRLFWFLTDDAYIAFRYVSNSVMGYGYVWNPPPFRPVEGYTSFLWVVMLDVCWRLFGVEPPDCANYLSLAFSCLTLALGAVMVLRMNLTQQLQRHRVALAGVVLLGVVSNRTFLAWTSSGLETAMFNLFLTLWVYCCLFLPACSSKWLAGITVAAVLAYLTRPDGILIAAATICLAGMAMKVKWGNNELRMNDLFAIVPLLAAPIHLAWRRAVYGEWLPNTYYAKTFFGSMWPESGLRYFLSFVAEYSLWFWFILLFSLMFLKWKQSGYRCARVLHSLDLGRLMVDLDKPAGDSRVFPSGSVRMLWLVVAAALSGIIVFAAGHHIPGCFLMVGALLGVLLLGILQLPLLPSLVVGTLLLHFFYYTLVIGGDHFEFRVYSHLILFLFITCVWMLNALRLRAQSLVLLLVLFVVFSWPIQWTHWFITREMTAREKTSFLKAPVAEPFRSRLQPVLPLALDYLRWYDRTQFWLIDHAVCIRHQEHKVFHRFLLDTLPSRAEGMKVANEDYPVTVHLSVGVLAWVLPKVYVIDMLGLNDYVIARNPVRGRTLMAHERRPPPGYLACLSPNLEVRDKKVVITTRAIPLIAEKIIECEQRYADIVTHGQL